MLLKRRNLLTSFLATGGAGLLGGRLLPGLIPSALAQAKRTLDVKVVGFTLGIHIPTMYALSHGLEEIPGYNAARITRLDRLPVITQSIVAEQGDVADGDVITTLKAAEAGADIKVIGLTYNNTSQVFVVNADRVKSLEDLTKPDITVAVNSMGDFTHVLLLGPLLGRGIDISRLTIVEIGGSGNRTRALLSRRVDAVPVHFDQAEDLAKRGNFKVMIEPWVEYKAWFGEVLFTTERWLKSEKNQRAAVDLLKAVLTSFRRANRDLDWYTQQYQVHAAMPNARQSSAEDVRPVWEALSRKIKAWPDNMDTLTPENFAALIPVYQKADALKGTVDLQRVIDRTYLDLALKELS